MHQHLLRNHIKRIQRRASEPQIANLQRYTEAVQHAPMGPHRAQLILGQAEEMGNLRGIQPFRETLTSQIGSMIHLTTRRCRFTAYTFQPKKIENLRPTQIRRFCSKKHKLPPNINNLLSGTFCTSVT